MHNRALGFFERRQDTCVISDLYGSGFHAVAEKWDFKTSGGAHQNYMFEQKRTATQGEGAFAEDIKEQIIKLRAADIVIFEFPLWWGSTPAIMKGWFDKVFALGVTWDGDHRYDTGLLRGKQALVVTSTGDAANYYSAEGMHKATVEQHLYPLLHSTLAHAGMDVLKPYVATGLTTASAEEREQYLENLQQYLQQTVDTPSFLYKHA
jgi:NAD(P)H dehydrogenase (quinone)